MVDTGQVARGAAEEVPQHKGLLICPVFLDVEVPLPGQVVVLVIVSELGLDDVVAAGQHAFGSLLHRG